MALISEFVARYRREFDFYERAAKLAHQTLDSSLQSSGIRSIVTSRAKSLVRLEAKCRQRAILKNYQTIDDMNNDIVDLAGVRVALYFPDEAVIVRKAIESLFDVVEPPKEFPEGPVGPGKRFSGYSAMHFRVRLKPGSLSDSDKRHADAMVEIQVASVLMHAWAEVEHDLVYKPLQGELSEDEYAILDELNGLVIAGEIALGRLQRAVERRLTESAGPFNNHYELASHVLNITDALIGTPLRESELGRIDLLFDLLVELGLATPSDLAPYVAEFDVDLERRPVAEQVIDALIAADPNRYRAFERIRFDSSRSEDSPDPDVPNAELGRQAALGEFVTKWAELEDLVKRHSSPLGPSRQGFLLSRRYIEVLAPPLSNLQDFDQIRQLRNRAIHGTQRPSEPELRTAIGSLNEWLSALRSVDG
jgi:ppGpp synthetase/RelA/SpoT-type nucleotidyltranferase